MTQTINFNGITGEILTSSGHGNYLIVALSDNVSVCLTKSNKWNWEETDDVDLPFKAFVTYIGCQNHSQAQLILEWAMSNGCEFDIGKGEDQPRPSKRIRDKNKFPIELKIRGLTSELVCAFV